MSEKQPETPEEWAQAIRAGLKLWHGSHQDKATLLPILAAIRDAVLEEAAKWLEENRDHMCNASRSLRALKDKQ